MRKLYFALNALLSPHVRDLGGNVRVALVTDRELVNAEFNEDVLSVEVDETTATDYSGSEGYTTLSEMRRAGKEPEGLWRQTEGGLYRYNGPFSFLKDAEVVVKAQSHNLETIPHIRVIITADKELQTNPWWWKEESVQVLLKQFAPSWAAISYVGVKVNDKAFEAYYIPLVIKPQQVEEVVTHLVTAAGTALTNIGKAFHSFDNKEIDLDLFL